MSGLRSRLSLLVRVALFALAIYALWRELRGISGGELAAGLSGLSWSRMTVALLFTCASFLALGAIELLALRSGDGAARAVPPGRALVTGFVAHAFSQSIGFGFLTQAAVRLRAYGAHGVGGAAVALVSVVVTATEMVGLLFVGSVALLAATPPPAIVPFNVHMAPIGLVLGVAAIAVLAWSLRPLGSARDRSWRPRPLAVAALLALSLLDWLLAASVLFVLLPAGIVTPFVSFLAAYTAAQLLAVISHVPGGAGVLEAVIIGIVAGDAGPDTRSAVLASLLLFRVCYYLLPLAVAISIAARADTARASLSTAAKH